MGESDISQILNSAQAQYIERKQWLTTVKTLHYFIQTLLYHMQWYQQILHEPYLCYSISHLSISIPEEHYSLISIPFQVKGNWLAAH